MPDRWAPRPNVGRVSLQCRICDQIVQASHIVAGITIDLVGRIGTALLNDVMPVRRTRTRQRVIKRAISKYRAKSRDTDRRTYPATLDTTILTARPDG